MNLAAEVSGMVAETWALTLIIALKDASSGADGFSTSRKQISNQPAPAFPTNRSSVGNTISNSIQKQMFSKWLIQVEYGCQGAQGPWTRDPRGLGTITTKLKKCQECPPPLPPSQTKLTHWHISII